MLKSKLIIPTQDVQLGLPKTVSSLCPECKKVIKAEILEKNNKVWMEKRCEEHGFFEDIISPDVDLYLRVEKLTFADGVGVAKPNVKSTSNCPFDCGICNKHKSHGCVVNIDLTNRCNLKCPICFANANAAGYVYELTFEQIVKALKNIKNTYRVHNNAVQFSGGEPTIHKDFLRAVKTAKDMRFKHILVATNGIKFADLEFVRKAKKAGLEALYLQFDGTDDKFYIQTRGKALFKIKKKVIENCRKVNLKVVLVPTLLKTVNDKEIGNIIDFVIKNHDVTVSIAFQPVSFTGRISTKERLKKRFTVYDLAIEIEKQTGYIKKEDWYPYSIMSPLSNLLSFIQGKRLFNGTCHSNCGTATFLFLNKKTRETVALGEIFDVEKLAADIEKLNEDIKNGDEIPFKTFVALKLFTILRKQFKKNNGHHFTFAEMLKLFLGMLKFNIGAVSIKSDWTALYMMGMHFQDLYNYNIDRVQRCVVHYSAPDGKLYPFCTYNAGPFFREMVEKQYSIPLEEWKKSQR